MPRFSLYRAAQWVIALCLLAFITKLLLSIVQGPPFPILKNPALFWASFMLIGCGGGVLGLARRRNRQQRPAEQGLRALTVITAVALTAATALGLTI